MRQIPVEVETNSIFGISLEESPSTGYIWQFDEIQKDGGLIFIDSHWMERDRHLQAVGNGGIHSFHFKALRPGRYEVTFKKLRPWMKDDVVDAVTYSILAIEGNV